MHLFAFCKKNFWILSYFLIISFLLVERDVMQVNVNKFIFVPIVLMFSIFSSYEQLIAIMCFTIPMLNGLPGNYFIPIWLLLILIHEKVMATRNMRYGIIFCVIVFIMEILHYPLYGFSIDLMKVVEIFATLLLVVFLISQHKVKDYSNSLISFCIGCSVFLIIVVLIYMSKPELFLTGERFSGDTLREDGEMMLALNANMVGFFSVASIITSLLLWHYKSISTLICVLLVATSFIGGAYTISRTWAICLVLSLSLFFFIRKGSRIYGIIILGLIVGVGVYYLSMTDNQLIDMFYERFSDDNVATGGARTNITSMYNKFLLKNPFELVFGTSALLYKDVVGLEPSVHNGTQQILVCYGLVGLAVFIFFLYLAFKKYYTKGEIVSIIPLLISLLYIQTLQSINPGQALYPLAMAFLVMKMVKNDKQKMAKL